MTVQPIGIVIPALNEAASIGTVVAQAGTYGRVIVVDDGSTDGTSAIAQSAGADIVRHTCNRGYDAALNAGFKQAAAQGCQFVITMDADCQHDPQLLSKFIEEFERGTDIVIGVRNSRQRITEFIFSLIASLCWGISDPLCGMKGYSMKIYQKRGHFDSYESIGTELALYAVRSGFRMAEIPVMTRRRLGSPRFGTIFRSNYKIFRALLLAGKMTKP